MLGGSTGVLGWVSGPSKWSEALVHLFGVFFHFYKEINTISFIAFKVNLFFSCLMSKQYYLQSKFNPCLEGAAHWVGVCCAVYGYGPCHTGCVGWCVPCHSSCLTGAAHQALAVPLSVLPQHWLAGTGFRCV